MGVSLFSALGTGKTVGNVSDICPASDCVLSSRCLPFPGLKGRKNSLTLFVASSCRIISSKNVSIGRVCKRDGIPENVRGVKFRLLLVLSLVSTPCRLVTYPTHTVHVSKCAHKHAKWAMHSTFFKLLDAAPASYPVSFLSCSEPSAAGVASARMRCHNLPPQLLVALCGCVAHGGSSCF